MIKLNKSKRDRDIKILYWSIIGLSILILILSKKINSNSLVRNGFVSTARIYIINKGSLKGREIVIKYFFEYKGKKFYGGTDSWLSYSVRDQLLNKDFPVLIDSTNPKNNVLLFSPKWWNKINKEMPDSVKWVISYY